MNKLVIVLFIFVANCVALLLTYHSFDKKLDKNKRMLYTMIAVGTMYILISIIYFFSSIGIEKEVSENSKNMITFTFVPVNSIILLPFLINSYKKARQKEIKMESLNKRVIIIGIIAIILIISEFFYFRNIQNGIIRMMNELSNNVSENVINN